MTEFWRKWLIVAAGITALAGLGFATLAAIGATETLDAMFDLVYLPGELEAPAGEVASFAMGVAGAVMVGWAATMLILLRSPGTHQSRQQPQGSIQLGSHHGTSDRGRW